MGEKLLIGRYIPYDSFVHNLDARSKLLVTILYIGLLFMANNWLGYLVLVLFALLGIHLSKIPIAYFIKGIRPMIWLITFTAALQIFFTPAANPLFSFGLISVSEAGITRGIFIFMRFILIIVISTLLTLTTEALEIADAIEFYLQPLNKLNFPVAETTMMLSISLRFVPTMVDEADVIMNAQRSRGVSFEEGTIIDRIKSFIPVLIPLFISSYDRAPQLATAMEARAYQGGENRTKYRQLIWRKDDTLVLLTIVVIYSIVYVLRS